MGCCRSAPEEPESESASEEFTYSEVYLEHPTINASLGAENVEISDDKFGRNEDKLILQPVNKRMLTDYFLWYIEPSLQKQANEADSEEAASQTYKYYLRNKGNFCYLEYKDNGTFGFTPGWGTLFDIEDNKLSFDHEDLDGNCQCLTITNNIISYANEKR
eukprot:UN01430